MTMPTFKPNLIFMKCGLLLWSTKLNCMEYRRLLPTKEEVGEQYRISNKELPRDLPCSGILYCAGNIGCGRGK
jgi:hypothetical protein